MKRSNAYFLLAGFNRKTPMTLNGALQGVVHFTAMATTGFLAVLFMLSMLVSAGNLKGGWYVGLPLALTILATWTAVRCFREVAERIKPLDELATIVDLSAPGAQQQNSQSE